MSNSSGLTHILTELSSLDDLGLLLKRSARLKYTCISASKKYLALGSNTGGVYIFSRDTLKYQQVVFADSNSTPVTCVSLSPTDLHIATAISSGHVAVFELNIDRRIKPERVRHTFDHSNNTVTALTWDANGTKLFVGDVTGKLSTVFVPSKNKALFALPSEVIAYLDVSIFQMDWWENKLLVSTVTNCFLFDTSKHNFSTIGSKKRDGEFGACIFLEPSSQYPVIYCARPGSRIWEVDFEGKVMNTHQFKQLLSIPPVPVVNLMNDSYSPAVTTKVQGAQSVSFSKMIRLGSLILTWSSKGLYLFDPINVKVMVWTDSFLGIRDIALCGNDAYLFLENSSVHRLTLLSVYPVFQLLASRGRWSLMSYLLLSSEQINIHPSIIKRVKKDLFDSLLNGLRENGRTEMVEKLYVMMDDVSEGSISSLNAADDFMGSPETLLGHMTLPSGMVVVSGGVTVDWTDTEQEFGFLGKDEEGGSEEGKGDVVNSDREKSLKGNGQEHWKEVNDDGGNRDFIYREVKDGENVEIFHGDSMNNNHENGLPQSDSVDGVMSEMNEKTNDGENDLIASVGDSVKVYETREDVLEHRHSHDHDHIQQNRPDSLMCEFRNNGNEFVLNSLEKDNNSEHDAIVLNIDKREENNLQTSSVGSLDSISRKDLNKAMGSIQPISSSSIENGSEHRNEKSICEQNSPNSLENDNSDNNTKEHLIPNVDSLLKDTEQVNATSEFVVKTRAQSDISSPEAWQQQTQDTLPSPSNSTVRRFSNVEVNSDDVIAQAVRKPKRRKKKVLTPDCPDRTMSDSLRKQMLRSASCGDLGQTSLYQHKEKDRDTISITTISSIEEDETEEHISRLSYSPENEASSNFAQRRKQSYDSVSLYEEYSRHEDLDPEPFQSSYEGSRKSQVIPPLIDRLAAAKGGEQPSSRTTDGSSSSNSPLTESGEFAARMTQLKDGISMKLKSQTKQFIQSLKEKKSLTASPSFSSLPHVSQSGKTSVREPSTMSSQSEGAIRFDEVVAENVSSVDRLSVEAEAAGVVGDQLASLYRRAVRIQAAIKASNLAMKPTAFKNLLNDWCHELNATMYRFLVELKCIQRERDKGDDLRLELSGEIEKVDERKEHGDEGEGDSQSNNGETSLDEDTDLTQMNNSSTKHDIGNHFQSLHSSQELNELSSSHNDIEDVSVSFISQTLHVNDPFHLPAHQQEAFYDLCTLCFLCGATGDILNTFHLSGPITQFQLVSSYLPKHLLPIVTSNSSAQRDPLLSMVQLSSSSDLSLPKCPCTTISPNVELNSPCDSSNDHKPWCPHYHNYKSNDNNNNDKDISKATKDSSADKIVDAESRSEEVESFVESSNASQTEDLELAMFLRLFFFLLDFDLIKQEVNRWCSSKFLTWTSLIACCQEKGKGDIVSSLLSDKQTDSAIDYLRSGILLHPSALLGHLHSLFQYCPAKTAEFCCEIPTSITPLEVIAMCLLADKSPIEPWLRYVKKSILDVSSHQRSSVLGNLCESPVVRFLLLKALLPKRGCDSNKGKEGSVAQGLAAKVLSVLPSDWFDQIMSRVVSLEEQDLILRLCLTLRLWQPCVHLMSKREDKKPLIDLLVAVGDMDLLQEDGYVPQTMEEWKLLLSGFLKVQNTKLRKTADEETLSNQIAAAGATENNRSPQIVAHITTNEIISGEHDDVASQEHSQMEAESDEVQNDENINDDEANIKVTEQQTIWQCCEDSSSLNGKQDTDFVSALPLPNSPMTWESLGKLLLRHVGGATTIEMLSQAMDQYIHTDRPPLTPELLQACLTDFSVKADQNYLCHEMLERMSIYMWAKKPEFLPPSVCHIVKLEARGGGASDDGEELVHHRVSSLLQSTPSNRLMSEYLGTHWGQEINVKQTCLTCQLPLRLIVSHDVPGVIIFTCGHIFHKKCCPDSTCPVLH